MTAGRIVVAVAIAALVATPAAAQVLRRPLLGDFEDIYLVTGRVVDREGWPVNQAILTVSVDNLEGIRVEDTKIGTDCRGDFIAYFDLKTIPRGRGRVTVSVDRPDGLAGFQPTSRTQDVDVVFRRNDFSIVLAFDWPSTCPAENNARTYWHGLASVRGRVVEGHAKAFDVNGSSVYARPVPYWPVDMNVTVNRDGMRWPPDSTIPTDERGDFLYSWTFDDNVTVASIEVVVKGVRTRVDVDPVARVAFVKLNLGETPDLGTPAAGAAIVAIAIVVAAVAGRARRRE